MAHCIPTYMLASGLIALGMNWSRRSSRSCSANIIVLVPMLLNSQPDQDGIPFPVFARASFGVRGANVPALMRALRRLRLVRHPDLDRRRSDLHPDRRDRSATLEHADA